VAAIGLGVGVLVGAALAFTQSDRFWVQLVLFVAPVLVLGLAGWYAAGARRRRD